MTDRKPTEACLAWHFLAADRRMANETGDDAIVEAGYIYSHDGPYVLCESGLHASVRAIDAFLYAPGPVVCRVRCSGTIVHGEDKLVCQHREVLWMAEVTERDWRLLACQFVRHTPLADGRVVWDLLTDQRSRRAVETAERFANGKASRAELAAARVDAWAAVAAAGAAWAAWAAAGGAAGGAAGAAWAAWAAAGGAAGNAQNVMAIEMLMRHAPEGYRE